MLCRTATLVDFGGYAQRLLNYGAQRVDERPDWARSDDARGRVPTALHTNDAVLPELFVLKHDDRPTAHPDHVFDNSFWVVVKLCVELIALLGTRRRRRACGCQRGHHDPCSDYGLAVVPNAL